MSKHYLLTLFVLGAAALSSCSTSSKVTQLHPNLNVTDEKVFLQGYDVVAYHKVNRAVKGSPQHSTTHQGATFHFADAANKGAFEKSPAKYLPKYGGYCAFAVANGKAGVPANPETFKVRDGELLVFFNDLYEGKPFNTKTPWDANEDALYSKAEANWPNLKK